MRRPTYPKAPFGLNLTPMIDVVFQLLIFFVCTVQFQRPEAGLDTNLKAIGGRGAGQASDTEMDLGRIDVVVLVEAVEVRFQGRTRSFSSPDSSAALRELMNQLQAWTRVDRNIPVRIDCRPEVPTGAMLRVYDACLQAGLTNVGLSQATGSRQQ